jgi:hypothetical protein
VSRRRRQATSISYPEIDVICTDRGQHAPVTLDTLTDYRTAMPPGRIVSSYSTARESTRGLQVVHDRPDPVTAIREDGGFTFTWSCGECTPVRTVQRREETLGADLDRLYATFPVNTRRYKLPFSYAD